MKGLFESYIPDNFCKEFFELRGHSDRIVLYMAVVLGLKPLLDDWIQPDVPDNFIRICGKKYGLHVKTDAVWEDEATDEFLSSIPGGDALTTTKFLGERYSSRMTSGHVHVFVSSSKDSLERGFRCGWYPLVINNIIINKQWMDYIWFGHELGYPDCCVDFFARNNGKGKFLYSIFQNTTGKLDYHCNCIAKDTPFSYIYHMPCSYNCAKTIDYAKTLKKEIKKHEPHFVTATETHLRRPFLVFKEQFSYAFEGKADGNNIRYNEFFFLGKDRGCSRSRYDYYGDELKKADRIEVNNRDIRLFKHDKQTGTVPKEEIGEGFVLSF